MNPEVDLAQDLNVPSTLIVICFKDKSDQSGLQGGSRSSKT